MPGANIKGLQFTNISTPNGVDLTKAKKLANVTFGNDDYLTSLDLSNTVVANQQLDDFDATVSNVLEITNCKNLSSLMLPKNPIGVINIYDLFETVVKIKMRNMTLNINEIEKKSSMEKDKVIKKLMKEIDTLHSQSTIDPLTGLFNVRYFNKIIEEEVERAKRYKYSISIIFMDLDHFKDINDIYGHDCGNVVLHGIGKLLSNASDNIHMLRKSDIAIRYGGEEFIVICPNTKKEQAYIVAERIRKTVEKKRFNYESTIINVTVSVGIAEHKGTSKKPIADTIKNADSAMYEAKHLGRNKVILH